MKINKTTVLTLVVLISSSCTNKSEEDALNAVFQGAWTHVETNYTRHNSDGSSTVITDESPYVLRYRYDNRVDQIHPVTAVGIYSYELKAGQIIEHQNNNSTTTISLPSTATLSFKGDTLFMDALHTAYEQRLIFVRP